MAYPLDMDEIPEERLAAEIARRANMRLRGLCDYCGAVSTAPTCKFPERHGARTNVCSKHNSPLTPVGTKWHCRKCWMDRANATGHSGDATHDERGKALEWPPPFPRAVSYPAPERFPGVNPRVAEAVEADQERRKAMYPPSTERPTPTGTGRADYDPRPGFGRDAENG